MQRSKVVCIIQARMTSSRLPGKVMLPLAGKTMLARIVERCQKAGKLDEVVVATTIEPQDDSIGDLARESSWPVFRGSTTDLLDRYHACAIEYRADIVVRVTSDCPFIDPDLIDEVVAVMDNGIDCDYASNILPPRTFPRGLDAEAFTFSALQRAWREDRDPAWREHVTPYFYRHPEIFRLLPIRNTIDFSQYRWTVDTQEDYDLASLVYNHFQNEDFGWSDMIQLFHSHPEWASINRHVEQKAG